MANAITRQVIQNGAVNYIVKFTIVGDGSGEETATRVNSVTGDIGTTSKLLSVDASLNGFSATLLWDATTDVTCMTLPADSYINHNFKKFGGLINNAGTGVTGDLNITTVGLGSGDAGTLVLHFRKV